ncbi:CHAT domain-containing protein [candidate division KSB1 bacterium]|nr:CHAT domain-containing protein [candidate division KSB1 bacterium]
MEKAITLLPADQARSRANTWITLGMAYLKQHVFAKARSAFLQAERIATGGNIRIIQVESRLGQGRVALAEGLALQAQAYFVSSLDMARRIHEESLAAEALYGISEAQRQTGNVEEALATLNRALLLGETLRTSLHDDSSRVSYFSVRQDWFDTAMLSALQLGDTSGAFHYAERARAQAMRDALVAGALARDTSALAPASWLTIPPTGDLQRRIPENVQVLEYRVTADTLLLWLLESDKVRMRRIAITAAALEDTVQQFLQSVGATAYDDFRRRCKDNLALVYFQNQRLGKILFRILLEPIARELVKEKHLYIIPDAGLHLIPWGALVDAEDKFFGASHAWAKAPSLTILASESTSHAHPPINAASQLLMVAGEWASTTKQKHSLQGMFKNFALLHEARASFENVQQALAAGADIGYFSVRAVADMHQPWNSYMELAGEQAESRWQPRKAYVRELSAWDFSKIHLLILNACETASGKIERGEGGMSMARFFTRALVPHVVASLWQNDDHISAQIVNEFMRGLQQEQDMIYGLRQATRRCIEELQRDYHYPLPYFWAVFALHEVDFSNSTHPKFN